MTKKDYKVLMIEDNPTDEHYIKEILSESERANFIVDHQGTLTSGFDHLRKNGADVVLLDLNLPDSHALKTINHVKEVAEEFPILILTGNDEQEFALKAIHAGAQDYLLKDEIEPDSLGRAIIYAIERHRVMTKPESIKAEERIKVLLVDDSIIAQGILKKMLYQTSEIQVIGTAGNGEEALKLIEKYDPDVICTDFYMPKMNGFELTKAVMERFPRPILVVSTAVQEENKTNIFKLLEAGAVDIFPKPRLGFRIDSDIKQMSQGLIDKIKEISQIDVSKKRETVIPEPTEEMAEIPISREGLPKIIAFGASIGGPQMLKTIFTKLPEHFPLPIVCVQRISGEFLRSLVDWLKSNCKVNVQIANSDMIPQKGTIYFPQPEKHLEFDAHDGTIILTSNPPFKGHRPSITVTFQSMAEAYGKDCIAVFLAGMGNDGMEGLESVQTAGGTTITQDKESSVVFLQAKQAIEQGLVDHVVNIKKMPTFLAELITSTA